MSQYLLKLENTCSYRPAFSEKFIEHTWLSVSLTVGDHQSGFTSVKSSYNFTFYSSLWQVIQVNSTRMWATL